LHAKKTSSTEGERRTALTDSPVTNLIENDPSDNSDDWYSGSECLSINMHPSHYDAHATKLSGESLFTGQVTANIYGAFYQNGQILGLLCSVNFIGTSAPAGPEVPAALQPTQLQMSVPHPPWIDRFPFPRMRDNMITLLGLVNEEDFLADLFCLSSFTIRAGGASWDPESWTIGREFESKWGFLFH
jgi:hypothetical protein